MMGDRAPRHAFDTAMSLGGDGGIVVQGRQVCEARVRGDEWRNVH